MKFELVSYSSKSLELGKFKFSEWELTSTHRMKEGDLREKIFTIQRIVHFAIVTSPEDTN